MVICFYNVNDEYGCFSNFSHFSITLNGIEWITSEHFFQAMKFRHTDPSYYQRIKKTKTPREAAELGRDRRHVIDPKWDAKKDNIMRIAVARKVLTHSNIADLLVHTGEESIVENSPRDLYWGTGSDGTGRNQLGIIWMEVRTELNNQTLRTYLQRYAEQHNINI